RPIGTIPPGTKISVAVAARYREGKVRPNPCDSACAQPPSRPFDDGEACVSVGAGGRRFASAGVSRYRFRTASRQWDRASPPHDEAGPPGRLWTLQATGGERSR